MLTKEHAVVDVDFTHGRIVPDRLGQKRHAHYVQLAAKMLRIYASAVGLSRGEIHRQIHNLFAGEKDCPLRRIEAFCKLLDDKSQFDSDRARTAAALRLEVFQLAAPHHPLTALPGSAGVDRQATARREIAQRIGRPWSQIEADLYADLPSEKRLTRFDGYSGPGNLLSRYNVAQVQACLLSAIAMTVWAREDFKTILRHAKLARLMHTIERLPDGRMRMRFDGPASVLRRTPRYGAAMARFVAGLIACRDWWMHAVVQTRRRGWKLAFDLSSEDGLRSHVKRPPEFDSSIEASLAAAWGPSRDGWRLVREGDVLCSGQKVFTPDFTLHHENGSRVLLEIVGFWTPEYIAHKAQTLTRFRHHRIVIAVPEHRRMQLPDLGLPVVTYTKQIDPAAVLDAIPT